MPTMPQLISASRCCDTGPTFFFSLTVEVYQVRVRVRAKAAPSYQLLQCPECWSN